MDGILYLLNLAGQTLQAQDRQGQFLLARIEELEAALAEARKKATEPKPDA